MFRRMTSSSGNTPEWCKKKWCFSYMVAPTLTRLGKCHDCPFARISYRIKNEEDKP